MLETRCNNVNWPNLHFLVSFPPPILKIDWLCSFPNFRNQYRKWKINSLLLFSIYFYFPPFVTNHFTPTGVTANTGWILKITSDVRSPDRAILWLSLYLPSFLFLANHSVHACVWNLEFHTLYNYRAQGHRGTEGWRAGGWKVIKLSFYSATCRLFSLILISPQPTHISRPESSQRHRLRKPHWLYFSFQTSSVR